MRYKRLDLNLLTALRVLLAEKSITRAGAVLGLTQSSMSKILARLRDYFDDPLVVQLGRRMILTPLAESLVDPINGVLMQIDTTITTRPEFQPSTASRNFSIVASDYSTSVVLVQALRRIHSEAPGISVDIRSPSQTAARELESGEVDFIVSPESMMSATQSGCVLFEDAYVIVVDAKNTAVGNSLTLQKYLDLRHVAFESGRTGLPQFERWIVNRFGGDRVVEVTSHSFVNLAQLVIGTARIATMQLRLALQLASYLPVRLVRAEFEIPALIEMLQWHTYRDLDPGSLWFRTRVSEVANSLLPLRNLTVG